MARVTLKKLAKTGKIDRFVVEKAADLIAAYHLNCTVSPGSIHEPTNQDQILPSFIEERRNVGCFRICHGGLSLKNIEYELASPGLPKIVNAAHEDVIKDTICDLSDVLGELQMFGLKAEANILFNRYFDVTGGVANEPATLTALQYHMGLTLNQTSVAPMMVAVGGLSGGGKSRMSRELAPLFHNAPGARVVRTDVVRKRMMGVDLSDRLGSHGYTQENDRQTYARFYNELSKSLKQGHPVIADAVFANQGQREAVEEIAQILNVPFFGLWVDAPADVRANRVEKRKNNVSDVTSDVIQRQLEYDLGAINWHKVDSSGLKDETIKTGRTIVGL